MNICQSNNQIINYLNDPHFENKDHLDIIKKINLVKNHDKWFDSNVINNVNKRRILASNSMTHNSTFLQSWDKANLWVINQVMQNQILSLDKINYINSLLTNNDLKTVRRKTEVYSGNTKYIEFSLLNKMLKTLDYLLIFDKDEDIHPLKLSFEIYLRIVTLHPFVDANGRTSRLAADWILLQFGYLPHLFPSTVSSMVAITLGGPLRTKSESYYKFLHAVLNSYRMAEIHLKSQNEKSNEKQYITYS